MATSLAGPDVAALIRAQRLCYAATVTPEGRPSLSPKGTIRVLDEERLCFLDLASPGTVANLRSNPWIELNVVDPLSRRGYRFRGHATLHLGDELHTQALERIAENEGAAYYAHTVVVVHVQEILPLWSPGYDRTPEERQMRELWQARRSELDRAFEAHLEAHGYFMPPGGEPPA